MSMSTPLKKSARSSVSIAGREKRSCSRLCPRKAERFWKTVLEDVAAVRERDPAARSNWEILWTYSGLHAVMIYRLSHRLYEKKRYLAARWLSQAGRFLTGIEIHPGAKIGRGLFIDHGAGVVIGETTEIGDWCTIYQGVTLGGTGKDQGKRHPTLGNNVMIGAGAKVLGPFRVGDHVKIAANAVVLEAVPDNSTAVGVPARIVRKDGKRVEPAADRQRKKAASSRCSCDMDQVHIPDPVAQELCKLQIRLEDVEHVLRLQKRQDELKAHLEQRYQRRDENREASEENEKSGGKTE